MNLYQYLTQPDTLNVVVRLIRTNVLTNANVINHIRIYEAYLKHPATTRKERYESIAKDYRIKPDTVRKIIANLKQKIK